MSAADDMRDRFIAHQIYLQRFAGGLRNRLLEVLNKSDDPLAKKLSEELQSFEGLTPQETADKFQKLEAMVNSITSVRDDAWQQVQRDFLDEIKALSEHEFDFTTSVIRAVLPDSVDVLAVLVERIAAAVGSRPFEGRLLKDWADDLKTADLARLKDAITQGVIEGRTVDEMVRIVRGSKAADYADGILQISRRNAESVVRTAVNHVSNVARDDVFAANSDIIAGVKWVSTLDGRTSAICRGRDGHVAPTPGREDELPADYPRLVPSNVRPPAHWGCRSTVVAVFDLATISEQLGERPYVRDSRTRKQREIDFRAEAKADVGEAEWKRLGEEGRKPLIKAKRDAWAEANIGRVPAGVTYDEWLRKQPAAFQDDVLGKGKAQLFRQGMKLDRFVDQAGKEMTLKQLSDLDSMPATKIKTLSLERKNETSQRFDVQVAETLNSLPQKVLKKLAESDAKIITARKLVDVFPDLATRKIKGHPDQSRGVTIEGQHRVVDGKSVIGVSEFRFDRKGDAYIESNRIPGTIRHELGHAWDKNFGKSSSDRLYSISSSNELIKAYYDDIRGITELQRQKFAYFLQPNETGRKEVVAEAFAILNGGGGITNMKMLDEFKALFGRSVSVVQKTLE